MMAPAGLLASEELWSLLSVSSIWETVPPVPTYHFLRHHCMHAFLQRHAGLGWELIVELFHSLSVFLCLVARDESADHEIALSHGQDLDALSDTCSFAVHVDSWCSS